jgi:uncharacterized protein YbjT (DUF2867 family)
MIVITGATGNIGSKTVSKLLAGNKEVKVIARNADKLKELGSKGAIVETGDMHDVNFLTQAFTGAEAVLLIIPPDLQAENIAVHQDKIGNVQLEAIKNSGVKNVVFISSQGAQDIENTGVISGLGRHEIRLNGLPDSVNVLSLRAASFMENLFNQIGVIKSMNIMGSPVKADLKMATIATEDIAEVASRKLSDLDFKGKSHLDLLGDRDYSQTEIASIIGKAIGNENLPYVEFSFEDNKSALMQYGISESVADGFNGMYRGMNEGYLSIAKRTEESTTPTSLESFANNVFKYAMA